MRVMHVIIVVSAFLATYCAGCGQKAGGIFYVAGGGSVVELKGNEVTAEEQFGGNSGHETGAFRASEGVFLAAATQLAVTASTRPADSASSTATDISSTQAVPYTSPRGNIRQLAFLALLGSASPGSESSASKQASEAGVASLSSLSAGGAASLAAPQPRTLAAVVGQSGLQRGYAAGLGFARKPNIFTPQANPLTGPNGRCQELIRAGFFTNQAACSKCFGH